MSQTPLSSAPQFIAVPLTGMQICRRLPLPHLPAADKDAVWQAAAALGYRPGGAAAGVPGIVRLVADHIACDQGIETTGWIMPEPREMVFYRLVKIGTDVALDVAVDTSSGAGRQVRNRIGFFVNTGMLFWSRRHDLASVYVAPNSEPRNVPGTLVMDFGNTATSFIFFPAGTKPLEARPLPLHNPFDPLEGDLRKRPEPLRAILPSTALLLQVPDTAGAEPWLVLGMRAQEVIASPSSDPLATSMYAPKKYVRDWPPHMRSQEPTLARRGLMGQQTGLFPALSFVRQAVKSMLQLAISSQVNPRMASVRPEMYPQVREVLLSYPLTWREQDKELFSGIVREAAESLFVLDEDARSRFRVELICSEPAAIAAYALWQVFFQHYRLAPDGRNLRQPSLASSLLGNADGTTLLRVLVLDIGGGSTDVALTEADWAVGEDGVMVRFQVLESLRYNRAGDRLSHLVATALLTYLREKHGLAETLDFSQNARNPAFTRHYKRAAICAIMELVEQCKAHLSGAGGEAPWIFAAETESELMRWLSPACDRAAASDAQACRLEISRDVLRQWIEDDRQSMESRGEPGFMDIFFDLEELQRSLAASGRLPHLVLLSGRTTRLPFFRSMAARHLKMPLHRVRTLQELLPASLHSADTPNSDKFGVVHGAHRFRFGHPINFVQVPEEPKFKRFIGVLEQAYSGLHLVPTQILARPGDAHKRACKVRIAPQATILIGHAFRADSNRAEAIASLSNTTEQAQEAEIILETDYHLKLAGTRGGERLILTERVSGGVESIVDNFNDTGRIDEEPPGLIARIVLGNKDRWIVS